MSKFYVSNLIVSKKIKKCIENNNNNNNNNTLW